MPTAAADEHDADVIQVLGINDFHGRIQNNAFGSEAGGAVLAGAVQQLRSEYTNTVFSAAGDLIGASTFESFIAHDKPTIDVLNEAGLEVSAVGNHEFDQGYDDLVNRVMAPYDEDTNPHGGAEWEYIGANVKKKVDGTQADGLEPSWVQNLGDYQVAFVGAVTEHLDELVSPGGIADIEATDIVSAVNTEAEALRTGGADVVVLLVHEGAPTTALSSAIEPGTDFGDIVNGVSADVDAIISGHTHLAYNHAIEVPAWSDRAVTERPVVSAGQYGANLNQLLFSFDPDTSELVDIEQNILALKTNPTTPNYPADAATQAIVDAAVAEADVLGAEVIGEIDGPFNRAKLANGTTENRGGESTLGNLVAEVQQEQTSAEIAGSAEIAFMNPGGLRADMVGNPGGYPTDLTYKQAAEVQPFANTLVNMTLTGAQVKTALEQQWQPSGSSRPFLKLGISEGLTYTYDPAGPAGDRVTQIWLHGTPIDPSADYSVTVNSFLSTGGDNFSVFAAGTERRDTGKTDLQGMVDYLAEQVGAISPDYTQRAVGVSFLEGEAEAYWPGESVHVDLSSLAFSTAADVTDDTVEVSLDGDLLGTFPVDNTVGTDIRDEYGTAELDVPLPDDLTPGDYTLDVVGTTTGTETSFDIAVEAAGAPIASESGLDVAPATLVVNKDTGIATVSVGNGSSLTAKGEVEVFVDGELAGQGNLRGGSFDVELGPFDTVGTVDVSASYLGDVRSSASQADVVEVEVVPNESTVSTTVTPSNPVAGSGPVTVTATVATDGEPDATGDVEFRVDGELVDTVAIDGDGVATLSLGTFTEAGSVVVDAAYLGDATTAPSAAEPLTVTVAKAASKTKVKKKPKKAKVNKTRVRLKIEVKAAGLTPSGKVKVKVDGKTRKGKLNANGKVTIKLPAFKTTGKKKAKVVYLGDKAVKKSKKTVTIKVRR